METGSIVSWKKKEGDKVVEGDLLAEIETDKAVMGFEAQEAGFIAKILIPQGARDIKLGTPLLAIVSKQDLVAAFKDIAVSDISGPAPAAAAPAPPAPAPAAAAPPPPPPPPAPTAACPLAAAAPPPSSPATGPVAASPFAKTLAQQKGIDLRMVTGTGPNGEITAKDVEAAAVAGVAAPSPVAAPAAPIVVPPGAAFVDIPLTGFRKTIAKRLTQSKQSIPHYYLSKEIQMDQILKLRAELNAELKAEAKKGEQATKLSVNDFVMKAAALACRRVPEVNSAWMDTYIRQYNQVDMSMAVATSQGLITPIIFNADTKGLVQINKDAISLAKLARDGKLQPPQFQGGSFTVSNLGMFGISFFTAVINPPQSCILAVGGTEKRVVLDDKEPRGFRAADVVTVTLSCDHRVVDGAVGAEWLLQLQKLLESPYHMLL